VCHGTQGEQASRATPAGFGQVGHVVHAGGADPFIASLAAAQRGVVTHRQLIDAGVGRGAIAHRLAQARLHRLHRGVYLVGHSVPPPLARETAALLACGPGALLSHRTAAHLWRLTPRLPVDVDVTLIGGNRRGRPGLAIHRTRAIEGAERARVQGMPVTAPTRTLLDLADTLRSEELEPILAEAVRRRLVRTGDLRKRLGDAGGRHGLGRLRSLLEQTGGPALTRSEAERRLLALVRSGGLPAPDTNVSVGRYEVDLLWREARLIVEVDGYAYHSGRPAFERDRKRDAELQALGFRVMRVTWRQLVDEPEAVLVRIAQALVN
jgi:very-short-patch-repair endonuclease